MRDVNDCLEMPPSKAVDELENRNRRNALIQIFRLQERGERITTYRLGKALDVATSTAKSRADPLVELDLVREEWEEVSERGADTRVYSVTRKGKRALREAVKNRLEKLEEERDMLEMILEELG